MGYKHYVKCKTRRKVRYTKLVPNAFEMVYIKNDFKKSPAFLPIVAIIYKNGRGKISTKSICAIHCFTYFNIMSH